MPEDKEPHERRGPPEEPEPMEEKTGPRSLIEGVARAIGRTAGRTKDALARLGGRGAIAIAMRRLEREKSNILEELGRIARKSVSRPDGIITGDDPRVAEIVRALDRLDEKLDRMRRRLSELAKAQPSGEETQGDAAKDDTSEEGGAFEGPHPGAQGTDPSGGPSGTG